MIYRYCIVGNGLIGAAVACHLSVRSQSICVIGATFGAQGRYYSSHEGDTKIARSYHADEYWRELAERNVPMITKLMDQTSIEIYRSLPVLYTPSVVRERDRETLARTVERVDEYSARFTYRDPRGGIINPTRYISAMNTVARANGAKVIEAVVEQINRVNGIFIIETTFGTLFSEMIVDARGVHSDQMTRGLIEVVGKIVISVESDSQATHGCEGAFAFVDEDVSGVAFRQVYGIHCLPYVGHTYLSRFGFAERSPVVLTSAESVSEWFQMDFQHYPLLRAAQEWIARFCHHAIRRTVVTPCAFSATPSGHLCIERQGPYMTVGGCNGMAAHCCQAIAEQVVSHFDRDT